MGSLWKWHTNVMQYSINSSFSFLYILSFFILSHFLLKLILFSTKFLNLKKSILKFCFVHSLEFWRINRNINIFKYFDMCVPTTWNKIHLQIKKYSIYTEDIFHSIQICQLCIVFFDSHIHSKFRGRGGITLSFSFKIRLWPFCANYFPILGRKKF